MKLLKGHQTSNAHLTRSDLLLEVLFQESKQKQEALLCWDHAESLFQAFSSRYTAAVIHSDVQRLVLERKSRQILNLTAVMHYLAGIRNQNTLSTGPLFLLQHACRSAHHLSSSTMKHLMGTIAHTKPFVAQ